MERVRTSAGLSLGWLVFSEIPVAVRDMGEYENDEHFSDDVVKKLHHVAKLAQKKFEATESPVSSDN